MLVSLANNHALDANFTGLLRTLAILDEIWIRHVGAGPDLAEASRPVQFEVPTFYRSLARDLVSSGARFIWGHCPHHFQGVERKFRAVFRAVTILNP